MIKRPCAFVFALTLTLTLFSCSDRPAGLDETEETAPETEEYTAPPKDYLAQLADNPGYADFPDSVWCYQPALVSEEDFVTVDEIEFDPDEPTDGRFISYNYSRQVEFISEDTGDGYITSYPNVNYLTSPDGRRTKLCPYDDCREDTWEPCTHINLDGGWVLGDWVYFTGANRCIAAPNHPNRSDENNAVNMLLRYSLKEHRIEKLLDLPGTATPAFCAYGVLCLGVPDPLSGTRYFILVDKNSNAAKAPLILHCNTPCGGYLYGSYDGKLYRCSYNLTERTEIPLTHSGSTLYPAIFGVSHERLYLRILDTAGDPKNSVEDQSGHNTTLVLLDTKGKETPLLDGVYDAVVTPNYLYVTMRDTRYVFSVTDIHGDETTFYANSGSQVIRYSLASDGTIEGDGTVVFDSETDAAAEGEYLHSIEPYGDSIRIMTFFAPPLEGNRICGSRMYLLTDDGIIEDGEELMRQY